MSPTDPGTAHGGDPKEGGESGEHAGAEIGHAAAGAEIGQALAAHAAAEAEAGQTPAGHAKAEAEAEIDQTLAEHAEPSPLTALGNAISANFRRALLAGLLAFAGLALTYISGGVVRNSQVQAPVEFFTKHTGAGQTAAIAGAVLFFFFGVIAVRSATNEILKTVPPSLDDNRKNGLRWVCLLVGYLLVFFGTLGALNVPIERLLVGGAVTGVIVGIAAQQSLGNLFAGLVLLLTRPFSIGDEVSLRSGPLGGVLTGLVADMSLTYVKLVTDRGTILLPNSSILSASVGPPGVFDA